MALRYDLINAAIDQAQFATRGKNINEQYEGIIQHIEANGLLINKETEVAKNGLLITKMLKTLYV